MAAISFELASPTRIVFGAGVLSQVGTILGGLGAKRILLVTGRSSARADHLVAGLSLGVSAIRYAIPAEPTLDMVEEGRAIASREKCDIVVALGGGSAIDAGKAIAALSGSGASDLLDHMEVIGRALPLARPGLPCIAIPTTAGTGAEVTRNSVLASLEKKVKASLRSPYLLPVVALVDPNLLDGLPREVLAPTGLDALSHLLESFVSIRSNPFSTALAKEGMARLARSLEPAFDKGLTA